jgi:hypothetical protein
MNCLSRRRLELPLRLIYAHDGHPRDFPVRIAITGSAHFDLCGKDVDLIVHEDFSRIGPSDASSQTIAHDMFGSACSVIETKMVLKYSFEEIDNEETTAREGDDNVPRLLASPSDLLTRHSKLSYGASLTFNVCCSMTNDVGRRCWRNGGACHVTLLELLGNAARSSKGSEAFTFREIRVSAYGVKPEDRLTGILGASLGEISSSLLGSFSKNIKWIPECLVESFSQSETFRLSMATKRRKKKKEGRIESVPRMNLDEAMRKLYGIECVVGFDEPKEGFNCRLDTVCDAKALAFAKSRSKFSSEALSCRKEYEKVLATQSARVDIVEPCTSKMRCPWTPMDTCVWEAFSDYDKDWGSIVGGPSESTAALISPFRISGHGRNSETDPRKGPTLVLDPSHRNLHSVDLNIVNVERRAQSGFDSSAFAPIGNKRCCQPNGLRFDWKCEKETARETSASEEVRVYLPFFAYLLCQPVQTYKSYWHAALSILFKRKGYFSLAEYERVFWKDYSPSRRAADGFQMICNYVQAIEYITDFYLPKRQGRCSGNFGETDGDDRGGILRDPDGRKEIEQFWNSLRAVCGDCDDLALGHFQLYRAFVVHSWDAPKTNSQIRSSSVLKEMRRLLAHNYVATFNIDAVYLPRQKSQMDKEGEELGPGRGCAREKKTSSTGTGDGRTSYFGVTEEYAWGDYSKDTAGMNSAHASIKLLPKKYFQRCVNRGSEFGPVFLHPAGENVGSGRSKEPARCCFYHAHPPDDYNDDLPVLFGEGTSMQMCWDEQSDPCKEEWFKKMMFSDPFINETVKSPIYSEKGKSSFYKASLFCATLDFLDNHSVATFTYARPKKPSSKFRSAFARGASHHHLSYKCEGVALVPYGLPKIEAPSFEGRLGNVAREPGLDSCDHVRFRTIEITPFMYHTCLRESKKRIRARKIKDPYRSAQLSEEEIRNAKLVPFENYDPVLHDGGGDLEGSQRLLFEWCQDLRDRFGITEFVASESGDSNSANALHLCFDNAYVGPELLSRLTQSIHRSFSEGLTKGTWDSSSRSINVECELERFSSDVKLWRLTFRFF